MMIVVTGYGFLLRMGATPMLRVSQGRTKIHGRETAQQKNYPRSPEDRLTHGQSSGTIRSSLPNGKAHSAYRMGLGHRWDLHDSAT
jgi:hypothetical protein